MVITKKIYTLFILGGLFLAGNAGAQDLDAAIKLTRAERFQDAEGAYRQLIQQTPSNGDIYYYYGENYLQEFFADTLNQVFKEKADSASIMYQKGVQADPSDPLNYVGLGNLALIFNNREEANKYYAKAISLMPSKQNKTIQMTPQKQSVVYTKIASGFVIAGVKDTAQVFGNLRMAEKLDKNNYDLYITRGDAYIYLLNDGSKAISNYNTASSINPKSSLAKLRIGQLWMRARNYQDALTYYQQVVAIDPSFAPAYRELGYLLARANRNEEAQQNYKKFLDLSAGNVQARIQYVNTLMELKKYKEAIDELNTILKSDPKNNDLNRALAYAYFETGQYDLGLQFSKKFFDNAKPEKIRALDYAYLGRLLAKTKQDSLAHEKLVEAFKMDTTRGELLSEAALSLIRVKKYEKAVEIYQMKNALGNITPIDYYNLGKVYYNMKQWDMADTTLARLSTLMPDFMQGYLWRARALVNIDSTSKLGLAKPIYEIMIEKAMTDTIKNSKELMEANSYLSYYYFLQYRETKDVQNAVKSAEYCRKVLAVQPPDPNYAEKAKAILKEVEPKIPKR